MLFNFFLIKEFRAHGSQCGYCTPGFVMAMYSLLRNTPKPTHEEIDEAIQGSFFKYKLSNSFPLTLLF